MTDSEKNLLSLKMNSRLLRRLQKHISDSNLHLDDKQTQQDWIKNAIREKLEKEENSEAIIPKTIQVSIRLEKSLAEELDGQISQIKDLSKSSKQKGVYSKKSWVLDAIEKKLEREVD